MEDQTKLKQEVLEFLRKNFIMSIAVAQDNKPSASILLYYIDDNFNFYFSTHQDSFKAKALKSNPLISLAVWEFNEMSIQADGIATEVVEQEEKLKILDFLADSASKRSDFWPPLLRIKGSDYVVFKITPSWLRKLDLKQDTMTQTQSPLIEIKL